MLQILLTLPVLKIVRVGRSAQDDQPIEVTVQVNRVETFQVVHRDASAAWPWADQPGA